MHEIFPPYDKFELFQGLPGGRDSKNRGSRGIGRFFACARVINA